MRRCINWSPFNQVVFRLPSQHLPRTLFTEWCLYSAPSTHLIYSLVFIFSTFHAHYLRYGVYIQSVTSTHLIYGVYSQQLPCTLFTVFILSTYHAPYFRCFFTTPSTHLIFGVYSPHLPCTLFTVFIFNTFHAPYSIYVAYYQHLPCTLFTVFILSTFCKKTYYKAICFLFIFFLQDLIMDILQRHLLYILYFVLCEYINFHPVIPRLCSILPFIGCV